MNDDDSINLSAKGEFILYTTDDGRSRVQCRFDEETIWLPQILLAELFETTIPNINQHLKAIYEEGELVESATIKEYLIVQQEGSREVSRNVKHYNLEAILAVGYRVRSKRGAQFRRWATQILQEYLVKGFAMDDERLKNPPVPGASPVPDYFDELLDRIRDIRASERRMYLRVRDLFTMAADYEPTGKESVQFFRVIQNKLHFAITGKGSVLTVATYCLPAGQTLARKGRKEREPSFVGAVAGKQGNKGWSITTNDFAKTAVDDAESVNQ